MSLKMDIKDTVSLAYSNNKLFLLFILISLPNAFFSIYNHEWNIKGPDAFNPAIVIFSPVIFGFLSVYLFSGFCGILFLKMNSQKINLKVFFHIARKNFWWFFIISLLSGIYDVVIIIAKYFLKVEAIGWLHIIPTGYFLFFFSYCLVIMGYFSGSSLRPIRNSIALLFKRLDEIRLVYLIILVYLLLRTIEFKIEPAGDFIILSDSLWSILYDALNFLGLVYAYLKLDEVFYPDLQFDFTIIDKARN